MQFDEQYVDLLLVLSDFFYDIYSASTVSTEHTSTYVESNYLGL